MKGTHKPITGKDRNATFQLKKGVAVYGGFAGTETARTQRDPAARITILSGEIGAQAMVIIRTTLSPVQLARPWMASPSPRATPMELIPIITAAGCITLPTARS